MIRSIRNISVVQLLSLLLLIASLMVMGSRYVPAVHYETSPVSAEEAQDDDGGEVEMAFSEAIQAHFHVDLTFHCSLMEVVNAAVIHFTPVRAIDQHIPSISKNFRILLRRIISTNAP